MDLLDWRARTASAARAKPCPDPCGTCAKCRSRESHRPDQCRCRRPPRSPGRITRSLHSGTTDSCGRRTPKKARFDAFAAVADVRLVQERPERVLGHSRLQASARIRAMPPSHTASACVIPAISSGRFDRARMLHHLLAFEHVDALGAHEIETERIQAVERDAAIAPPPWSLTTSATMSLANAFAFSPAARRSSCSTSR